VLNPNIEARNPKQIKNSNVQKFETYVLVIWILAFRICFELRI